jgi:hypothetical protein
MVVEGLLEENGAIGIITAHLRCDNGHECALKAFWHTRRCYSDVHQCLFLANADEKGWTEP